MSLGTDRSYSAARNRMNKSRQITIENWSAWAPNVNSNENWLEWAKGHREIFGDEKVSVEFLSAMFRRRLSHHSKMALKVAYGCHSSDDPIRTIFCSRHGELHRSSGLLLDIAVKEELSPTAFSMSVHNTSSGMYAIAKKDQSPSLALAAGSDSFASAFAETLVLLHSGRSEKVMLIIVDELLPTLFSEFEDRGACNYAAAFLVSRDESAGQTMSFSMGVGNVNAVSSEPQAISFLRFLLKNDRQLVLTSNRVSWKWDSQ